MRLKRIIFISALLLVGIFSTHNISATIYHNSKSGELHIDGSEKKEKVNLSNYSNLKNITIINNGLTKVPSGLEKHKNLEYLDLSNNNLRTVNISNLKKLKTVSLRNNRLKSLSSLDKLSGIINLDLAGNHLTTLEGVEKLKKMVTLDASLNQINYIPNLNGLSKLKSLDLSDNQLLYLPKLPSKITRINLTENYLNKKNEKQYKSKIVNQEKIVLRKNITKTEIYKAMADSKYTKDLVVSSSGRAVVGFNKYKLFHKVNNKLYSTQSFLKNQNNFDVNKFSIAVDVVNNVNSSRRVTGSEIYGFSQAQYTQVVESLTSTTTPTEESEEEKDKVVTVTNSDNSSIIQNNDDNLFKGSVFSSFIQILSISLILPVILLTILSVYLVKMNRDTDKILYSKS